MNVALRRPWIIAILLMIGWFGTWGVPAIPMMNVAGAHGPPGIPAIAGAVGDAEEEGAADVDDVAQPSDTMPTTVTEARARAQLLHETLHGTLQVMHRDFFSEEDSIAIPSHSLEDVFKELASTYGVEVRWLVVNARAMNIDNEARNAFERGAAKALAAGKERVEKVSDGSYQYAGAIRLASQCLKCHLPSRSTNEDRVAGLVISMSIEP